GTVGRRPIRAAGGRPARVGRRVHAYGRPRVRLIPVGPPGAGLRNWWLVDNGGLPAAGTVLSGTRRRDAMNGWVRPDDALRDAPTYAPGAAELADLELLLSGAYAPLHGFMGGADLDALARTGRLADGSLWPVPVILEVPAALAAGVQP